MYYVHLVVGERDRERIYGGLDHSSWLRQVHPEPTQGTDPAGGHSPPWQSDPHQGCALSLRPAPQTSAGAAAWPGTGKPVLLQQSWPHPPATPSLKGTGWSRVLIPTPASLSQPLFPALPRRDLSLLPPTLHGPGGGDGSSGTASGLSLAPRWPPCLHLPLHNPHCPKHEILVSPCPAVTPWIVPWRPQGNVQTPQPWVTCTCAQLCRPWAGSAPPGFTLCPPSTRSHVQFPEHPKLFHASALAHVVPSS